MTSSTSTCCHVTLCLVLVSILLLPSGRCQVTSAKPASASGSGSGTGDSSSGPAAIPGGVRIEKDSLIERMMLTLAGYVLDANETLVMAVRAAPDTAAPYRSQLLLWQDTVDKMKLNTDGQTLQSLRQQLESMYSNLNAVIIPLGTMSLQPDVLSDGHFVMALKHVTSSVNNLKLELEKLWRFIAALLSNMRLLY